MYIEILIFQVFFLSTVKSFCTEYFESMNKTKIMGGWSPWRAFRWRTVVVRNIFTKKVILIERQQKEKCIKVWQVNNKKNIHFYLKIMGRFLSIFYHKRQDNNIQEHFFSFFFFIEAASVYGVYISQFIFQDFHNLSWFSKITKICYQRGYCTKISNENVLLTPSRKIFVNNGYVFY